MIPHTSAFEAAVVQTHDVEVRIEVFDPAGSGAVLFTFLNPNGGNVIRDRAQSPRVTCEFPIPGTLRDMVPSGMDPKIVLPFGTEVRIWRGIPDVELIPLAVCRLTTVDDEVALATGMSVRYRGADRSERFARKLLEPYDTPLDMNAGDDIRALLTQAWTGAGDGSNMPPFHMKATDHLTPALHLDAKTDAWGEAMRRATACGMDLFPEYDGAIAFLDLPSLDTPPVWAFVDGVNDTRVRLARSYSSEKTINYWTVNATHSSVSDQNISGTVWVDDPTSPLFVGGPFGTNPDWIDSVYATSEEQCLAEARALRSKTLMGTETLTIDAVPNPALLEGDVVTVTNEQLDIFDELRIIASIDMPLDVTSPMHLTVGRG